MPASIEIELSDPQQVETIASDLAADQDFIAICDNPEDSSDSVKYGEDSVDRLFSLTSYIRYIGVALIALLIFIALVFINNTIRLAILARRKEIAIMRLVGASNGFIRGPFLMEGVVHAVIGSALAIGSIELLRIDSRFLRLQTPLCGCLSICPQARMFRFIWSCWYSV